MSRVSESFVWGIRWETVERAAGAPLFGGVMPETYPSLRAARRELRRLARSQPARPNPFRGGVRKPVLYVVFARREDEVHGL
jgi:hypothetical protein